MSETYNWLVVGTRNAVIGQRAELKARQHMKRKKIVAKIQDSVTLVLVQPRSTGWLLTVLLKWRKTGVVTSARRDKRRGGMRRDTD